MKTYFNTEFRSIQAGTGWKLRIVLICPTPYPVGIANLGVQLVYAAFNTLPGVACHRVFSSETALSRRVTHALQAPRTLETNEPLSNYPVIAFSLNYENDLCLVPGILRAAGIPLLSSGRDARFPLVIAGGVVATINPEPFASLVDACVLGESEEVIPVLADRLAEHWVINRDKHSALEALESIPGVYIPGGFQPDYNRSQQFSGMKPADNRKQFALYRRYIRNLDTIPGGMVIHSPYSELSDLHLIEISRGCPGKCRFCLIPRCYGPFRCRSSASVATLCLHAPAGWRIGLLGAGSSEHPELTEICRELVSRKQNFSLSSLHVSGINPGLVSYIHAHGPKTLTFAPEVGDTARRKKTGKRFSNDDLLQAVSSVAVPPVQTIKLYFLTGLPGESRKDLDAIAELCMMVQATLRHANRASKAIPRLSVAISCYVPKALSPYERAAMNTEKEFKQKVHYLAGAVKKAREIRITANPPRQAIVQGILARGDRRLAGWLIQISEPGTDWYRTLSCLPRSWLESVYGPVPAHKPLPWDHLKIPLLCEQPEPGDKTDDIAG